MREYIAVGDCGKYTECLMFLLGFFKTVEEAQAKFEEEFAKRAKYFKDYVNCHAMAVEPKETWWHDSCD